MGQTMANPNFNIDVTVDDGKYRFTQDVEGHALVYRHGEPWIEGSFAGINMVIAMACELEEARDTLAREKETVVALEGLRPVWAQGWSDDSTAAQASAAALSDLWETLGVDNQTAAVEELAKLIHLRDAGIPHD